MAKELVSDELWEIVEPLLPEESPKPQGGRPRLDDRAALTGIVLVLKSGIPWEMLPKEMGCGSGVTCWRRLKEWQEAGVWQRLVQALLDRLGEADQIDWERASLDSASVPAKKGPKNRPESRPGGVDAITTTKVLPPNAEVLLPGPSETKACEPRPPSTPRESSPSLELREVSGAFSTPLFGCPNIQAGCSNGSEEIVGKCL
jgi:transposase